MSQNLGINNVDFEKTTRRVSCFAGFNSRDDFKETKVQRASILQIADVV